jgi:hypothetical protein
MEPTASASHCSHMQQPPCVVCVCVVVTPCSACVWLQDREGEGSKADSCFSSGLLTPSNPVAPGSPSARPGSPGSPNLLAMLLQTSYQPLVPGQWGWGGCVRACECCFWVCGEGMWWQECNCMLSSVQFAVA